MRIIGIDPGRTGGIAWLDLDAASKIRYAAAVKMPETEGAISAQLKELGQLRGAGVDVIAYLELVHAMPAVRQERNPNKVRDLVMAIAGGSYDSRVASILERAGVGVETKMMQGSVGTFTFGQGYGFLRGCLTTLGIPFESVRPQDWQAVNGCRTGGNKNISKERAIREFPSIPKITHAIADALLIANYGHKILRSDQKMNRRPAV